MTGKPLTIYSASAGSGKTFTLTAYYIAQLLRNPDPQGFKHLLAVTFTIKATAEMKDRILGTLYNLALISRRHLGPGELDQCGDAAASLGAIAGFVKGPGEAFAWEEVERLSAHAGECLAEILKHYDRFRVVTIDSFFQSVMRGVARELGLPATLRTEVSHDSVRRLAVERLMDSLTGAAQGELFGQVWRFVKSRIDADEKWSVGRLLYSFSEELYEESFSQHSDALAAQLGDPQVLIGLQQALDQEIADCDAALPLMIDEMERLIADKAVFDKPAFHGTARKVISGGLGKMRQWDNDALSKAYREMDEAKIAKSKAVPDEDMLHLLRLMKASCESYDSLLSRRNSALLSRRNLHQLGLIDAIRQFVSQINQEQGQFIVSDTTRLLATLLGGEEGESNVSFVFEKIGPKLSQVMIDEFQDTSRQQWANFKPLFLELLASGSGDRQNECLIVGDVKQSLYRWRNGSWEVLHRLPSDPDLGHYANLQPLSTNYRSAKEIVDFNNMVFPALAQRLDALNELPGEDPARVNLAEVYEGVVQQVPPGRAGQGYVYLRIYDRAPGHKYNLYRRDEATGCYADMRNQMLALREKGVAWGDMVILVRLKRRTPDIIQSFANDKRFEGVQVVSCDAFMLQSSWAVRLIIAVLRHLADPLDRVANAYCDHFAQQGVPVDLDAFAALADTPLQELNHTLIAKMRLGRYKDQGNYLSAYMDQVARYVQTNPADISSFLQHWDERLCREAVSNAGADAIRIVTYHVSKGLDFEHVFIPDDLNLCDIKADSRFWIDTAGKAAPYNALEVLPINLGASGADSSIFSRERLIEVMQQNMDAINMEYVAFTRARQSLYVWGLAQKEIKTTVKTEMVSLIGKVLDQTPAIQSLRDESTHSTLYTYGTPDRTFAKKPRQAKSPLEPLFATANPYPMHEGGYTPRYRQSTEAVRLIEGKEVSAMAQGTHMHCVLARVEQASDFPTALQRYRAEVALTESEATQIQQYFDNGLQESERLRDWFSGRYKVYNEQTLLLPQPLPGLDTTMPRPDRVMIQEEQRRVVVLDYKHTASSRVHDNKDQHLQYLLQVRAYMQVLAQIFPNHSVEGHIWYIKDNHIETVSPQ